MMSEDVVCLTSKENITNSSGSVTFPCPGCRKYEIVRSAHMREIGAKYTCPECGFVGPAQ
jgi:predicted RNA-binding Zn-ribbon protein involved in translation (DUF1610 family)